MAWAPTCASLQNFLNMIRYFELRPPPEFEITGPSGFIHTTHIGFNPITGGFEVIFLIDSHDAHWLQPCY